MTFEEFLILLEKYGKNKFIIQQGLIRNKENNCCPIEYTYARIKHKPVAKCAGHSLKLYVKLRLSKTDARAIMLASDKSIYASIRDGHTRFKLKQALNLNMPLKQKYNALV